MGCLSKGATGPGVSLVMVALQQEGLFSPTAILGSPYYDDSVAVAVMGYQRLHGLTVDGIVGPATARVMGVDPDYLTEACPGSVHDSGDGVLEMPPITITATRSSSSPSRGIGILILIAAGALAWQTR